MANISPVNLGNSLAIAGVSNFIYQPNRITNAHYNYTLIQERIMNAVIYLLQEAIRKRMNGENYMQLELFQNKVSNDIILEIPYKLIANKQQYPRVRESCKMLAGLVVEIPYIEKNNERIRYTGLFRADVPSIGDRSSFIRIEIDRHVAKLLVEVDLVDNKKAINYTKFGYNITRKARKKFTPRVYKLLCCYRAKGSLNITIDDFKKLLGIEGCYKYYRDLKKYVLLPVQEELIKLGADCWFNCEENGFEIKTSNKVIGLNFQVYSADFDKKREINRGLVRQVLKEDFYFNNTDMLSVDSLVKLSDPIQVLRKLEYIRNFLKNSNNIKDKRSYVITSLKNEFASS